MFDLFHATKAVKACLSWMLVSEVRSFDASQAVGYRIAQKVQSQSCLF